MVSAKAILRRNILQTRTDMPREVRERASHAASKHLLKQFKPGQGGTIAAYWPMGAELDCRDLLASLVARGDKICLPVVVGRDLPLIFRAWDGKSALHAAPFGTHIPGPEAAQIMPDLVILPLAGFDSRGTRLGYGKGFYDRTIAAMIKKPRLIGLAFGAQELEHIPAAVHDVPLHMIVTENGVIDFGQNDIRKESDPH